MEKVKKRSNVCFCRGLGSHICLKRFVGCHRIQPFVVQHMGRAVEMEAWKSFSDAIFSDVAIFFLNDGNHDPTVTLLVPLQLSVN